MRESCILLNKPASMLPYLGKLISGREKKASTAFGQKAGGSSQTAWEKSAKLENCKVRATFWQGKKRSSGTGRSLSDKETKSGL